MYVLPALVPVPVVPPGPPPTTDVSTLGWILGGLGIAGILGFAVLTLRAIWNIPARKHEVRIAAWLSFGGLALLLACYVEWRVHHHRQDVAWDTWWEAWQRADDTAQASLEDAYGLTFTDRTVVLPLGETWLPREMKVELPDGTPSTCWISSVDGHYEVSCGPTKDSATPLPPAVQNPSPASAIDAP